LVAIVADNVVTTTLVVSGRRRDVPIVNNSAYADLVALEPGEDVSLEAVYADGTVNSFPLVNPKGVR
jgi:hypothetical protein